MKKYDILSDTTDVDENLANLIEPSKLPNAVISEKNEFAVAVDNISDEVVDQINKLTLITPKDVAELKKAQAFILQTYTDVRQYRPMVNKLTSVLTDGRFPTPDAKYWQCKAEAEVHFNELKRDTFKYNRAKVDVDELIYKIESIEGMLAGTYAVTQQFDPNLVGFDLQRLKIKLSHYQFELKQLEKSIKYRIEEVTDWHKIAKDYEGMCIYSTRDPNEHTPDTHFKMLMWQAENAKTDEEAEVFKEQLRTYQRLLNNKKAEENAKEAVNKAKGN